MIFLFEIALAVLKTLGRLFMTSSNFYDFESGLRVVKILQVVKGMFLFFRSPEMQKIEVDFFVILFVSRFF